MRIGIFTDTYHPSLNGIVTVVDILRQQFEAAGHEVFIFASAATLKVNKQDPHILYFPAIKGIPYEDANAPLFFPPAVMRKIKDCRLDVYHFLTPGPVGLMGVYAAHVTKKPLIAEYCTDLFEYVEHYPVSLAALIALAFVLPFSIRGSAADLVDIMKVTRPRLGLSNWNRALVKDLLTILHSHCDAVIVHSRRSDEQLKSWQSHDYHYDTTLIPTGVDPLPAATQAECQAFAKAHGLSPDDEVLLYAGRISAEKNLDMLIPMLEKLVNVRPHAKMVLVGDFEYRATLEAKVAASPVAEQFVFTGRMPRNTLDAAFKNAHLFVFPSLKDTQGLVVHEAALAGLPLVLVDKKVSEVLRPGENGVYAKNDPADMAHKIAAILTDEPWRKAMGQASCAIASQFSEHTQAQKVLQLYARILKKTTPA